MPRDYYVTPKCCEGVEEGAVVYLNRLRDENYNEKPHWFVRAWNHEFQCNSQREADFCPLCGKPVPEIERRPDVKVKVCVITDGGYYCDTCGERLMCCKCYPSVYNWRPVKDGKI